MFKNTYKNKRVLVTGNTGFKGAWLSHWLVQLGAEVFGISNSIPTNPSLYEVLNLSKKIIHKNQDIRQSENIRKLVNQIKPDFIFHLAAQSIVSASYSDPLETISTNILGTANILDALKESKHPCIVIIITSDKCYENVEWKWGYRENDRLGGKDIYSASKGSAELLIHAYYNSFFKNQKANIRLVTVRAGNVIGGGDWAANRIVPDCYRAWSKKNAVKIRNPESTRPWQHVLEPLGGYLRAGQLLHQNKKLNGESYNFGPNTQQNQTVLNVLKKLSLTWNFKTAHKKFILNEKPSFHEAGLLKLNCDKALYELNWLPVLNFEETIQFTSEWYNHFYQEKCNMVEFTTSQINDYISIAKSKNIAWVI